MDTRAVRHENGKRFNKWDQEIIGCDLCGGLTTMLGTKRCDPCWELERRILADMRVAAKVFLPEFCGVSLEEFNEDGEHLLRQIGRAMHWSKDFHDAARTLANWYEGEARQWAAGGKADE